jgi:hypothetical protein
VLLDSCLPQRGQEGASKQATEDAHREEETFGARDPGAAVQGQATRWDKTMDMGMMVQGLPPGMQDPKKADLRA